MAAGLPFLFFAIGVNGIACVLLSAIHHHNKFLNKRCDSYREKSHCVSTQWLIFFI